MIRQTLRVTPGRKKYQNRKYLLLLDFRLSSGFECCISSFGYFPLVSLSAADLSEPSVSSIFKGSIQPLKMELTECSETSVALKLTPGKYPKEDIQRGSVLFDRFP
jgi:hypothetical protein